MRAVKMHNFHDATHAIDAENDIRPANLLAGENKDTTDEEFAASASPAGIRITCSHASRPDINPVQVSTRETKNRSTL